MINDKLLIQKQETKNKKQITINSKLQTTN